MRENGREYLGFFFFMDTRLDLVCTRMFAREWELLIKYTMYLVVLLFMVCIFLEFMPFGF